jgi:hypothetical protein
MHTMDRKTARALTLGMMDPDDRIATAHAVLAALYAAWETNGGPSPSTDDEARAVATALHVRPITDEATIEALWTLAMDGAELAEIAAAHVAAIDERATS